MSKILRDRQNKKEFLDSDRASKTITKEINENFDKWVDDKFFHDVLTFVYITLLDNQIVVKVRPTIETKARPKKKINNKSLNLIANEYFEKLSRDRDFVQEKLTNDIKKKIQKRGANSINVISEKKKHGLNVVLNARQRKQIKETGLSDKFEKYKSKKLKNKKVITKRQLDKYNRKAKKVFKKRLKKALEGVEGQEKIVNITKKVTNQLKRYNRKRMRLITSYHINVQKTLDDALLSEFVETELNSKKKKLKKKVKRFKKWQSLKDERVRPAHRVVDGKSVSEKKRFRIRKKGFIGELDVVKFKRDPEGKPWNVINCRCFLLFSFK